VLCKINSSLLLPPENFYMSAQGGHQLILLQMFKPIGIINNSVPIFFLILQSAYIESFHLLPTMFPVGILAEKEPSESL